MGVLPLRPPFLPPLVPLVRCTGDALPCWLGRGCTQRETSPLLPSFALLYIPRDFNQVISALSWSQQAEFILLADFLCTQSTRLKGVCTAISQLPAKKRVLHGNGEGTWHKRCSLASWTKLITPSLQGVHRSCLFFPHLLLFHPFHSLT